MKIGLLFFLALLLVSWLPAPAPAQLLQGQWVLDAQVRIHELRKGNVRVIVMGKGGKPAANAAVRIEQARHDFPLGFVAHQPEEIDAAGHDSDAPVMRVFNAVALDALTAWPTVQPQRDVDRSADVEAAIDAALARGLRVRYGGVVSADAGLLPEWAAALPDDELIAAVEDRVRRATALAPRVEAFDLYTHALTTGGVTARLGRANLRRLFHLAHAQIASSGGSSLPGAGVAIRVEDALVEQRVPEMLKRIRAIREAFVPIDALALEQRVGGILPQAQVERSFGLLDSFDLPIVLASLEVGGASESSAAVNLETVLRIAFASPRISGIYFAGLHAEDVADPTAALLQDNATPGTPGTPTEPGRLLDDLFRKLWWTDDAFATDELGNVNARVFAGNHRITATLPDGSRLETLIHVPVQPIDGLPMIILLEP